jgi:hypothetical protein
VKKIELGMKLDIGAGNPSEGENQAGYDYVLQDVAPHPGIDIVCDIRRLDYELINTFQKLIGEGRSDVCSEIRASHVLEHFHSKELTTKILPMLKNCLQDNGLLNIIVPNFAWHCSLVMQGQDERAVYMAFGRGNDEFDLHFTGWTGRLAYKWLEEAGFEIIDFYADTCLHIKCKKKL